jgi:hypothetical protein
MRQPLFSKLDGLYQFYSGISPLEISMFIASSLINCPGTIIRKVGMVKYADPRSILRRTRLAMLLPLVIIAFLPNTSFAQATLTDDLSTSSGPKGADLILVNNGGSPATVFLKFSFSGVPAESSVSRATLKLFVNSNTPGNPNQGSQYNIYLRHINNSWSEQSPTPQSNGTILAIVSGFIPSTLNYISIDITGLVRNWINGGPNNGIALGFGGGQKNALYLDSKENTFASHQPTLELVLDRITGVTATAGLVGGGTKGDIAIGIAEGGINTARLADGAVTSQKIASGAVTSTNIAAGAVGSQQLVDGSVTSSKIGQAAVGTPQLAAGAITSTNIASGAVGSAQLANGAVNGTHLADNSVTSAKIAPGEAVKSFNGLTDNVTLVAGNNVTITPSGNTLTISAATGSASSVPLVNPQQVALLKWYEANTSTSFNLPTIAVGAAYDGANIWVAHYDGGNIVTMVRANDGAILGSFPTGSQPYGVAYDGANIWVANSNGGTVTKIRASDGAVLGTYPAGSGPRRLVFDGANIWVANWDDDSVTKLRASDGVMLGTYPVSGHPHGIAFDGKDIWVTNTDSNTVTKLKGTDGSLLGIYPLGGASGPNSLAFDGTSIWAACGSNHAVKLRASDGAVMGVYSTGPGTPIGIVFDGVSMWVPHRHSATIVKIRASDGAVLGTFPTDADPYGVAFDGANVWLTHYRSTRLSKY